MFHFMTLQTEDKAFSPLQTGNTGPLHYNTEQMCSMCVCPDTRYRRVCTLSLSVFVVIPAYVAVTEAICLWHFALFLSSPTR